MESYLNISDFFKKVNFFLKPKGYFIFCYKASNLSEILFHMKSNKLTPEVIRFVHSKANKNAKLVLIYARLNSKSQIDIMPSLFIQQEKELSKEMEEIYKKANTYTIKSKSVPIL